jgi:hypothetical protein
MDKTPLKAGQSIIYQSGLQGDLTEGRHYTVLEDEYVTDGWRIIRVTCDDGIPRKVPPQAFTNESGEVLGCRKCYDRGFIRGGEERGEFIEQCDCQRQ